MILQGKSDSDIFFCPERDSRISTLESNMEKQKAVEEDLQHSLNHKEEAVSQLKSQLEHQCLGKALHLHHFYFCRIQPGGSPKGIARIKRRSWSER